MKIAVIVPFYNEAGNLPFFINEWETFLNLNKTDFKKSIFKIDSFMVFGYKTKYLDNSNDINFEISIYNEKYKKIMYQ